MGISQMKQYMTCFDGMMVKNPEQIAYLEQIGYDRRLPGQQVTMFMLIIKKRKRFYEIWAAVFVLALQSLRSKN